MNTVEEKLKEHRKKIGRLKVLRQRKKVLEGELEEIPDKVKYYNMADIIEFSPPTNKINRTIEEAAIETAQIHKDLQASLNIIIRQIAKLETEVRTINAVLAGLSDRERFVIDKLYFCGLKLYCLPNMFFEKFSETISQKTIIRLSKEAIKKMESLIR